MFRIKKRKVECVKQCVTCGMTGFDAVTQDIIVLVVSVECHKLIALTYAQTLTV